MWDLSHGSRASSKGSVHLQLVKQSTSCQLLWYSLRPVSIVLVYFDLQPQESSDSDMGCLSIADYEPWVSLVQPKEKPTAWYSWLLSSG